jgi:outer membrane lipoprotein-sorting protein
MSKFTAAAALFAVLALGFSLVCPVQAGTCQPVRAKGLAKTLATATLYAQADLKQTASSMKGKVTQATTNCLSIPSGFRCKIEAVVCPK